MAPALMTFKSLVNAACIIAGKDGLNADAVSEYLVQLVFLQVARKYAENDAKRALTLAVVPLTFTNGAADLGDQVLTDYLKYGVLRNALDETQTQKYVYVSWQEFTRPLTPVSLQLGTFSCHSTMDSDTVETISVVEPGETYDPTAGFTGNMTLTTPVAPTVPAADTDPINCPQEMQQDLLIGVARALTGQWMQPEVAA